MNKSLFLILLLIIGLSGAGFSIDEGDGSVLPVVVDPDLSPLKIIPGNFRVDMPDDFGSQIFDLMFEISLHNLSPAQKYDIMLPLEVVLKDEFGNVYLNKSADAKRQLSEASYPQLSLYPGEKIYFSFVFQAPVAAAKNLVLEVCDQTRTISRRMHYATSDITNWDMIDRGAVLSDDDVKIVYPESRRVFSPGDTVFLKLEFSEHAGRPDYVYVILPDHILKDAESKGQYEFQIASGTKEGDFQVIILAEWGERPRSQMISKILFLDIKG